jgi:heme exporter protein A
VNPVPPDLGLRLRGVRKDFGPQFALAGVDLDVPQGSYVAVMGPNGAGKTTLLKVMAGLATPTAGSVRLAGVEMRRAGPALRALVGFVAHETMLYADLSARDNLVFHARLLNVARVHERVEDLAERLGIGRVLDRPVRTLSRGTRQRAAIARALLHSPHVLMMDEPYTGLDEVGATTLAALLGELHTPERTLIVTVHEVSRALAGPERLVVLDQGRVALDRPLDGGAAEEISSAYRSLLHAGTEVVV